MSDETVSDPVPPEVTIGEVLVFDASRGVKTKRQWWRPWRKFVVEWEGSRRSAAAQQWIVETYLADKWDVDLYALIDFRGEVFRWNDRSGR